ncbi:MAG: RNA pseudouridine synthase [Gammaproteobacteria bacterium]
MSESAGQDPERLARRVAAQVPCSRAEAERFITGGWVRVDDQVVDRPEARVRPSQQVTLDPEASAEPLPPVTLLWHKPAGVALPEGFHLPTALALSWFDAGHRLPSDRPGGAVPRAQLHRLQPLMPLAMDASGLVVFSQHPAISRRLGEGAADLEQEWLIDLEVGAGLLPAEQKQSWLAQLNRPQGPQALRLPPLRASWQSDSRLRLATKGWTSANLLRQLQSLALPVAGARRQRIGRVGMGSLAPGQWRQLGIGERF